MQRLRITALIGCLILLHGVIATGAHAQQKGAPPNGIPLATPDRTVGLAEISYFPDSNETSVDVLNLNIWGSGNNRIDLHLSYKSPGRAPRLPEKIEIDIASISGKARFQGHSTIEFIVDGKRWEPVSVEDQVTEDAGSFLEDYVFMLGVEKFRQIGGAKSVIIKLGGMAVPLKASARKAFADMLSAAR
jgi:hypothetical protein